MAESKSIDQWQELFKSCHESVKNKAALSRANSVNYINFYIGARNSTRKTIHLFL